MFTSYLAWRGETRQAARERALRHFSAADIETGRIRAQSRVPGRIIQQLMSIAFLAVLVFGGGSRTLADFAAMCGLGSWILELLVFSVAFTLIFAVLQLPADWYQGYYLEGKFGMRTMGLSAWFWDFAKQAIVGLVLSACLLIIVFATVRCFPRAWPVLGAGALIAFAALMSFLFPVLITPIFYRQTPLEDETLKAEVLEVARKGGVPASEVYVIDFSKRYRYPNAYFAGMGRTKRVVLFDTLIQNFTVAESRSVLAHEVGHWNHGHIWKGFLLSALGVILGMLLLRLGIGNETVRQFFRFRSATDLAIIPAVLLAMEAGGILLAPLASGISRQFEREADREAIRITADPETFIATEKKLHALSKSDILPHPLLHFWYASHPTALQRIAMAEEALRTGP
jgi:STE24 endopeptidase